MPLVRSWPDRLLARHLRTFTQHDSQVITNYSTAANAGNATTNIDRISFSQPNAEWFLLSGMDVYGQYQGTGAVFGSSSIDGHNSDFGDTKAYPVPQVAVPGQGNARISDALARTLQCRRAPPWRA